jgi:hypothetical protein
VGEARWAPGVGFVRSDEPPARDVKHPKAPAVAKPSAGLLAKTGTTFTGEVDVAGAGYVHLEPPSGLFGSASGLQFLAFRMEGRWQIRPALLSPWFQLTGARLGVTFPERLKPEWNPPVVEGKTCDKFTTFSLRTGGSVGLDFVPWEFVAVGPMGGLWLTYTEVTFDFPGSKETGPKKPSHGDTDYGPGYGVHGRIGVPNRRGVLPWVYLDAAMTWRSGRFLKSQDLALEIGTFPGQLHAALLFETRLGTSGRVTYDFRGGPADASNLGEIYAYSMPVNRTVMALVGVAFAE